jgi:exodeoxyribonuclease-3
LRLVSWNVNGLRAVFKKGLFDWLDETDPDVVLFQETKAYPAGMPADLVDVPGWFVAYESAKRKGYSGVGIWTRFEPDEWIRGIGDEQFDDEGRLIGARFGNVVVCSIYFPNSAAKTARLDYKLAFNAAIEHFSARQRELGRHVILAGDFNVAHQDIDIARPKENQGSPGFLPEEREWFGSFLDSGFKDTWREQHPDTVDAYSWWSMRTRARERNIGWRIDYFVVDEAYWSKVRSTGIEADVEGSDHCPVTLVVDNPK